MYNLTILQSCEVVFDWMLDFVYIVITSMPSLHKKAKKLIVLIFR